MLGKLLEPSGESLELEIPHGDSSARPTLTVQLAWLGVVSPDSCTVEHCSQGAATPLIGPPLYTAILYTQKPEQDHPQHYVDARLRD